MTATNKTPNLPSKEVIAFGERVANALMDANIQQQMGGIGGCKTFDIRQFEEDLAPFVAGFIESGATDSLAFIFAAMKTKELELNQKV